MKREERVERIFEDLWRRYGGSFREDPGTALAKVTAETEDPFKVLISTILSQRTRDERTEEASRQLYVKYDTPERMAAAKVRDLQELIRPVGFYRQKAPKIREVSRILIERYGGRVPDTFDELVSLPQVGPKTANCVLVYGYGKPAIPVDVHVAVISRRLGLAPPQANEAEVERHLMKAVPKELWLQLNELFVRFGKDVCRTAAPRCEVCAFTSFCRFYATSRRNSHRRRGGGPPRRGLPPRSRRRTGPGRRGIRRR